MHEFSELQRDEIRRFIFAFLRDKKELRVRGSMQWTGKTLHVNLGPATPALVTDAHEAEIAQLGRELCSKFKLTVRHLPKEEASQRAFVLIG